MILKIAFIIPQKNCFLTLPISQRFTLIKRVLCIKTIALSSELVTLFSKMHQQFEHIFSMKNIFYKYPYNYTFVDEISCWVIFEHLLHYSFLFYFFFFIVNLVVQCIMYRKKRSPLQDTCICYECPSHNSIVLIFSLYD